jgi:hypothetical protein
MGAGMGGGEESVQVTFGRRVRVEKEADGAWTVAGNGCGEGGEGGAGGKAGSSSIVSATRRHAAAGMAIGAEQRSVVSAVQGRGCRRWSCSGAARCGSEEEVEVPGRFLRRPAMARSSSISSAEASSSDRLWYLPLAKRCESVALWAWIERMNEISSSSDRRDPCRPGRV